MEVPPQEQAKAEHQFLLNQPEYLQTKINALAKEVEQEENTWFKLEAWLWILLFVIILVGFKVPQRMRDAESLENVRVYLAITMVLAALVLSFVLFEALWIKLIGEKLVDKLSYFNAVMLVVLPVAFIALTFQEFSWLSLFLAFNAFMIVIMWPHAISVFSLIADKLRRKE